MRPRRPLPRRQLSPRKSPGAQKFPGYFNLYWDAKQGKLWLEIDKWNTEFLYQTGLPAGVGSNDIGLDRGQLGKTAIVRFERSGPKILLIEENLGYRAVTSDADERRAVHDSFAESALWGFTVAAEENCPASIDATQENCRALVDATDFFLRDAHGIPATLRRTKQGAYHLDASRCAIYLPQTKSFPLNTEVEATLTFSGDDPGPWVREVTPSPESITVREHHSFVQLPPPGLQAARLRSAQQFFRHRLHGLRNARQRSPSSSASPRGTASRKKIRTAAMSEAGPAHHLLSRPRCAGADSLRAARWCALVEPGL